MTLQIPTNSRLSPRPSALSILNSANVLGEPISETTEIAGIYSILERQQGFQSCYEQSWEILCFSTVGGLIGQAKWDNIGLFGGLVCGAIIGLIKNRQCASLTDLARDMTVADKLILLIHAQRMLRAFVASRVPAP